MALTHDGLQEPLPPSRLWQLIGLLVTVGGIAMIVVHWYCTGSIVAILGALTLGNQLGGISRVRVTFSKLLVEHERPVIGFLIGPVKQRIPWDELQGIEITGGKVVAKGQKTTLELGAGHNEAELQELARKIHDAVERHKAEGGT